MNDVVQYDGVDTEAAGDDLYPPVNIVDALMGTGKTTVALKMMQNIIGREDEHRLIYITPFLSEVDRIRGTLNEASLDNPFGRVVAYEPKPVPVRQGAETKRKLAHLNQMLLDGRNIVSTHAMFREADETTAAYLGAAWRYTLVIDEVTEWVSLYTDVSQPDLKMLFSQGRLSVSPTTNRLTWHDPPGGYSGKFDKLRTLCRLGKLVAAKRFLKDDPDLGQVPKLLLWQFPAELLPLFEAVYILTHLFDGSDMAAYLRLHGVPVRKLTIAADRSTLIEYDAELERERVRKIRPLFDVVQDRRLNAVGDKPKKGQGQEQPLSVSWFKRDKESGGAKTTALKRCLYNFFRNHAETGSAKNLWTTFQEFKQALQQKPYTRAFLSCNARATNDWADRTSAAYCVNLFHHPWLRAYFEDAGVEVSADYYALLTMTQWLWRTAIRRGQPVTVYVPSERMRGLLMDWLDGKVPVAPGRAEEAGHFAANVSGQDVVGLRPEDVHPQPSSAVEEPLGGAEEELVADPA